MKKSNSPQTVFMGKEASVPADAGDSGNGSPGKSPRFGTRNARPKTRASERETGWRPKENVLEIVAAIGRFTTFGRAITAAGLTRQLSGTGPFTVFAPTDKAFAKMPSADLDALLGDKERLTTLLNRHVVSATVRAPRRQAPAQVVTLGGDAHEIRVVAEDGGYQIGDARIVKTNIRAANGVVHAIDTVLTG
jgi:uncharacterized surface protein with fasciclin (FAS1) repeats